MWHSLLNGQLPIMFNTQHGAFSCGPFSYPPSFLHVWEKFKHLKGGQAVLLKEKQLTKSSLTV